MEQTAVTAAGVWSKACKHLKEALSKDVFDRWISVIEPRQLDQEKMVLSVANNFYQSWLEDNYLPLIQHAVTAVHGVKLQILFDIDRSSPLQDEAGKEAAQSVPASAPAAAPAKAQERPASNRPAPALNP